MQSMWPYLLVAPLLASNYLIGRKRTIGWAVGLLGDSLWAVYGHVTGQVGFCVTAALYATVRLRGWYLWRRGDAQEAALRNQA